MTGVVVDASVVGVEDEPPRDPPEPLPDEPDEASDCGAAGVTLFEAVLVSLDPTALIALTVKV